MGFETCGPNEAMVISGCCFSKPLLISGGRKFVLPGIHQVQRISLNTMTITIESEKVYTSRGVAISVTGIAQVKVEGQNQKMLDDACQLFLGKTTSQILKVAQETLEGHQRAIMGNMTVEEIFQDRQKFSRAVFDVASTDLMSMGLTIVSYTIKDIRDDEGYLKALGMARTAQVHRDARIGEAEARRDAGIKKAEADELRMAAKYKNDIEIARSKRDFELQKAAYDMEVFGKKARADMAYELQAAKTRQRIKEETMEIEVVERTRQIDLQEQEITRKNRELDAQVKKPAEAEKYRLEQLAEANKRRVIMEAEAEAQAKQMKGEAEAYAIEAKAKAEAEQMAKKADAWKEYQDAAVVDMVLESLPRVAAEVAAPLHHVNKISMVSSGGHEIGASKLTGEVLDIMQRLPDLVTRMTGVDISKSMPSASR